MGPLYGRPVGWQPPEVDGMGDVHPDDRERVRAEFNSVIASGGGDVAPWRVIWPSGEIHWLDADVVVEQEAGHVKTVTGVVREVTQVVAAGEAAHRAEVSLRAAVNAMGDGIILRTGGTLAATLTNPAAAELLGVAEDELVAPYSMNSRWALYDDQGRRVLPEQTAARLALATETPHGAVYHVQRPDGQWRWITTRAVPFRQGREQDLAVMITFADLTNVRSLQKRLEQQTEEVRTQNEELAHQSRELVQAEARFRGVLTGMNEGVLLHAADGTLLLSNPAAQHFLGIDLDGDGWLDPVRGGWEAFDADGRLLAPDDHPTAITLATGQSTRDVVLGRRTADGGMRWLQVSAVPVLATGQLTSVITTLTDITAIKRARETLAEQESHFRLIATGTRDVVSLTDMAGVFEWVSPSIRSTLGWAPESLIGTLARDLVHPDDDDCSYGAGEGPGRASLPATVHRLRNAHGAYIWIETDVTPVPDEQGACTGYLRVMRDVTERREMEQRLSHAERLQAVGTLAGGLAHDFNNVLAVVRASGEQLQQQATTAQMRDDLATILSATERASSLTRQMLTFARRQVSVPVLTDVDHVLRYNESLFRHLLRSPQTLTLDLNGAEACIRIDPDELTTAIMNLITNAADAMATDGEVCISTFAEAHPQGEARTRSICIAVRDSGGGMSAEVVAQAFDPFFTTKATGKGTGLGLATVHGVVKAANGSVSLASAPGAGTTVTMCFTVDDVDRPIPSVDRSDTLTSDTPERAMHVLVVDDEPALCRLLARAVRGRGHRVSEALTVEAALAFLENVADPIDAVISDHLMPGRTGRSLIMEVHTRWPLVRCALVSGYTDESDTREWLESGEVPFLQKPFTLQALSDLLVVLAAASPMPVSSGR